MRRFLLLAAAALALAAVPAFAKTIHNARFQSPTKAIACGINIKLEGGGITCFAPYLPHKMLDGYVKLNPRGKAKLGERGDDPWLPSAHHVATLHYGDRWSGAGVHCSMATSGLTCKNRSHHGFFLSRQKQRYF
jgi:hypothetical protein